jgi:hypothetical protein
LPRRSLGEGGGTRRSTIRIKLKAKMQGRLQAELRLRRWMRAELAVEAQRVRYLELPARAQLAAELQLEPEVSPAPSVG